MASIMGGHEKNEDDLLEEVGLIEEEVEEKTEAEEVNILASMMGGHEKRETDMLEEVGLIEEEVEEKREKIETEE